MGFYATTTECTCREKMHVSRRSLPAKTDPPSKNRVWGFSATSRHRAWKSESQVLEPQQENQPTPTTTASGVHYYGYRYYSPELGRWPSRDPIGEQGGRHLYSFTGNNAIGRIDAFGLFTVTFEEDTGTHMSAEGHGPYTEGLLPSEDATGTANGTYAGGTRYGTASGSGATVFCKMWAKGQLWGSDNASWGGGGSQYVQPSGEFIYKIFVEPDSGEACKCVEISVSWSKDITVDPTAGLGGVNNGASVKLVLSSGSKKIDYRLSYPGGSDTPTLDGPTTSSLTDNPLKSDPFLLNGKQNVGSVGAYVAFEDGGSGASEVTFKSKMTVSVTVNELSSDQCD
jgi:RHS repeat-associated protein